MEGIQQTIFTAFKGAPSFTVSEAYKAVLEKKNVNTESIRARLYEGVSKGLFDRISRGVYKICKDASSVLCIMGDGRDLSDIPDASISASLYILISYTILSPVDTDIGVFACL